VRRGRCCRSIYLAVDAINHMRKSLELQKEFKPFCSGVDVINCTSSALKSIYKSVQHMLISIVELLASAIFATIAIYFAIKLIKIWIELND
jgi:hypothetical protein